VRGENEMIVLKSPNPALHELTSRNQTEGKSWTIAEMPSAFTSPFYKDSLRNELATQFIFPPRYFFLLTNSGISLVFSLYFPPFPPFSLQISINIYFSLLLSSNEFINFLKLSFTLCMPIYAGISIFWKQRPIDLLEQKLAESSGQLSKDINHFFVT